MDWKGNSMVFKGYATGTGKKATMKVKDAQLLQWDDVQGNQSFGAILNQDFVDISFDTDELSQKFWDMAEKNNWNCLILENPENGHIHSYWKDTEHRIENSSVIIYNTCPVYKVQTAQNRKYTYFNRLVGVNRIIKRLNNVK